MAKFGLLSLDGEYSSCIYDQSNQLEAYSNYCAEKDIIFSALVELTNKCNLHCYHCYHDEQISFLDFNRFKQTLKELDEIGTILITYTGGEIFTINNWHEILSYTKSSGFLVGLISNLTLLNDNDVDAICDINPYVISTSLYGSTSSTHDKITNTEGSFSSTLRNIERLKNRHINVKINYVVTKYNYNDALNTQKLANQLDCDISFDYKLFPTRTGNEDILSSTISRIMFKELHSNGLIGPVSEIMCLAAKNKIRINQRGEVYPCEYINIKCGNIYEESVSEVLCSDIFRQVRHRISSFLPDDCVMCSEKANCLRCPALPWLTTPFSNEKHQLMCHYAKFDKSYEGGKS